MIKCDIKIKCSEKKPRYNKIKYKYMKIRWDRNNSEIKRRKGEEAPSDNELRKGRRKVSTEIEYHGFG